LLVECYVRNGEQLSVKSPFVVGALLLRREGEGGISAQFPKRRRIRKRGKNARKYLSPFFSLCPSLSTAKPGFGAGNGPAGTVKEEEEILSPSLEIAFGHAKHPARRRRTPFLGTGAKTAVMHSNEEGIRCARCPSPLCHLVRHPNGKGGDEVPSLSLEGTLSSVADFVRNIESKLAVSRLAEVVSRRGEKGAGGN